MFAVPALAAFEESDWEAVSTAFKDAPILPFRQAWLETPHPDFRGGEVRLGWTGEGLWVFAQMEDECIFTQATADNQKLWTLGDVFEIFVGDLGEDGYLELHTAPNGHRLQLRFPSDLTFEQMRGGRGRLADLIVEDPLFRAHVRIIPGGWEVVACLTAVRGRTLRASFSRYDYRDAAARPVVSSTSPHSAFNFHAQREWAHFCLVD